MGAVGASACIGAFHARSYFSRLPTIAKTYPEVVQKFVEASAAIDVEIAAFELVMSEGWVGDATASLKTLRAAVAELAEARGKCERIASEAE